ncbi:hypothetical protein OH77DRAFT_535110 [Trametes cingulata]|nr:hypothetical protein OH77DRAFT_535110 [Trametes cingulata]
MMVDTPENILMVGGCSYQFATTDFVSTVGATLSETRAARVATLPERLTPSGCLQKYDLAARVVHGESMGLHSSHNPYRTYVAQRTTNAITLPPDIYTNLPLLAVMPLGLVMKLPLSDTFLSRSPSLMHLPRAPHLASRAISPRRHTPHRPLRPPALEPRSSSTQRQHAISLYAASRMKGQAPRRRRGGASRPAVRTRFVSCARPAPGRPAAD